MSDKIKLIPPDYKVGHKSVARSLFSEDKYDWNTRMLNLEVVHQRYTGKGVMIGIVDTGTVFGHSDLDDTHPSKAFIKESHDIGSNLTISDLSGHGTHVRGIIGMRKNGKGYVGVAPDSIQASAKGMDMEGEGTEYSIGDGIKWLGDIGCRYINLSLGFHGYSKVVHDAIKYARSKGCIIIGASGNDGISEVAFPANLPEVIAVGAIDYRKLLAKFSNTGNEVEVHGPGVNVRSAWIDGNYRPASGTSMSTPHVTGACALFEEYFIEKYGRQPTFQEVKEWLKESVQEINDVKVVTTDFEYNTNDVNNSSDDVEQPDSTGCLGSAVFALSLTAFIISAFIYFII